MHTETIGAVVDRLAEYSVLAHTALNCDTRQPHMHYVWQQLAELSLGYGDLALNSPQEPAASRAAWFSNRLCARKSQQPTAIF